MALSQDLFDAIADGKAPLARLVEEALAKGADPVALITETMIPATGSVS
jgi:methanogenic corrinoid protein MtbC1